MSSRVKRTLIAAANDGNFFCALAFGFKRMDFEVRRRSGRVLKGPTDRKCDSEES